MRTTLLLGFGLAAAAAAAYSVHHSTPTSAPVAVAAEPLAAPAPSPEVAPVPQLVAAPAPRAVSVPTPGQGGMMIALDPETGEYGMPSAEQRAELEALGLERSVSRDAENLVEVHSPDGTVSVHLQGRFQDYSVARVGADGKLHLDCVHDENHLESVLHTHPAGLEEK